MNRKNIERLFSAFYAHKNLALAGIFVFVSALVFVFASGDVKKAYAVEERPVNALIGTAYSAEGGGAYNMGMSFTVNTPGYVDKLWLRAGYTGTVRIYRVSDQAVMATASVTASGIGTWSSASITPVNLATGTYIVASYNGFTYPYYTSFTPATTGSITVNGAWYGTGDTYPSTNWSNSYAAGITDISFHVGSPGGYGTTTTQSGNWNVGTTWGGACTTSCVAGVDYPSTSENVTIANGHTVTLTANQGAGNLALAGTLNSGSYTFTLSGTGGITRTGSGSFNGGTGTLEYTSGSGATLVNSSGWYTINNLTINGSGNFDMGSNYFSGNNYTVNSGTLIGSPTIEIYGSFTGNGGVNLSGGYTYIFTTSTASFGGNSGWTFNYLLLGEDGSPTITASGSGSITATTLAIQSVFNAGSKNYIITGSGTPVTLGGTFNSQTSTFTYTSTTGATLLSAVTYNNLTIAPASGSTPTFAFANSTSLNGSLLVNGVSGTVLTANGIGYLALDSSTSSVTISSGNTLIAPGSGSILYVGNDFANSGTFTHNSGTVRFWTSSQADISGNTTFYNLYSDIAGKAIRFAAGSTTTVNGLMTFTGGSGNNITLNSSTGSSSWTINHQGTESITYTTVTYSACHGSSTTITATGTGNIDGGNNGVCWSLPSSEQRPFNTMAGAPNAGSSAGDYNLGYTFTPNANGTITKLWYNAASGTGTVSVYRVSDSSLLGSAVVTPTGLGSWASVTLGSPIALTSGVQYIVAVRNSGSQYATQTNWSTNYTAGDVTINQSIYGNGSSVPTIALGANYYGYPDITFCSGCSVPASTTLATGTDPSATTIAPSASIVDGGAFSVSTNTGTDSITALNVSLHSSGTPYNGVSEVRITSDNGSVTYFSAQTNPGSNTVSFSAGTPIPVTTTPTQFKIRITPKTHANMPAVPGATYDLQATVSSFTSSNSQSGSDTNSNTLTIDNTSPNGATSTSGSAGNTAVTLNWTSSNSSDITQIVVLRRASSAVTDVPVEGSSYSNGNTIGSSTVVCVMTVSASTGYSKINGTGGDGNCLTTALTNGTAYHYKIFQKDTRGNYDAGVTFTGSPFTPIAAVTTLGSSGASSSSTIAPGSSIIDAGDFTLITNTGTDSITALTVTLAASGTPYSGVAEVRITNSAGSTTYFTAQTNPGSNSVSFSGGTPIPVTTGSATFKIRITPKSHANMPAVPGATYTLNTYVSAFTSTNSQAGSNTNGITINIDNLSPGGATSVSGSGGDQRVLLGWTSNASGQYNMVLRWTGGSAGAETPTEGSTYSINSTIGTATVACWAAIGPSTFGQYEGLGGNTYCNTTALAAGTTYTYKVFQGDSNGNYDAGVLIGSFTTTVPYNLTTTQSGNWNVGTTWGGVCASSCVAGTHYPNTNESVVIANGHTVTLTATQTAVSVTINNGGTLSLGSNQLNLSGTGTPLTRNGTFTAGTGTVNYTSGSGVTALSSAAMTGSNKFYSLVIAGTGTFPVTSNIEVGGAFTVSSGTFNATSYTVTMNSGSSISNGATMLFGNLYVAASATVTANTSFYVSGELNIGAGATLNPTSGTITLAGGATITNAGTLSFYNFTVDAPTFTPLYINASYTVKNVFAIGGSNTVVHQSGTVTFNNGASISNGGADEITFFNLTVAASATLTANTDFRIGGTLTVSSSATLAPTTGNATMLNGSSIVNSGGTLTFANLVIASSAAVSATGNFTVRSGSTMTVNSGAVFTPNASTVITGTSATITGSGSVKVTRTTATADFNTQYAFTTKTLTNLIVDYAGTGQSLSNLTYGALRISGTLNGATATAAVGTAFEVASGGNFSPSSGTITMNTGSTIYNSGTLTFRNLTTASSATVSTSQSFSVAGIFTNGTTATFSAGSGTVTMNGGSTISNGGTALNFSSLTISGGTVTADTSFSIAGTLSVGAGSTLNPTSGTITLNNGTVIGSTLGGTLSFFNLTTANSSSLTTGSNSNFTVKGALTLGSSAVLNATNSSVTMNNGSSIVNPSGTLTFGTLSVANSATVTANTSFTVGQLTVGSGATLNPTSGTITVGNGSSGSITNSGTLSFQDVAFSASAGVGSSANFTVKSSLVVNSGSYFSASSGTVTFNSGSGFVNSGTGLLFSGLTIGAGTVNPNSSNYSVAGLLTVSGGGTLTNTGNTVTLNNGASLSNAGALTFANLTIENSATVTGNTSYTVTGALVNGTGATYTSNLGTVTMNNGSSISNGGTQLTFNNLTLANSATVSASTDYTVLDTLTVGTGATLAPSAGTITLSKVGAPISNSGTFAPTGSNVIRYASSFSNVAAMTYAGLTLGSGSVGTYVMPETTLTLKSNLVINNNATISKGAGTIVLSGGTTQTITDNNATKQDIGAVQVNSGANTSGLVDVLIIGGGGGGGKGATRQGGGGGAGQHRFQSGVTVTAQSYTMTIGNGGAGATSATGANGSTGGSSSAFGFTAVGGGGGASNVNIAGSSGASGGGGSGSTTNSSNTAAGGSGTNGFNGGTGRGSSTTTTRAGGGGGGSSAGGSNATNSTGGNGGAGTASSITGSSVTRAAGGGGAGTSGGSGGTGGGGNGATSAVTGTIGTANTGSGGGGGTSSFNGMAGGSGVVIVRYLTSDFGTVTGGTATTDGAYTVRTFNSTDTFTPSFASIPTTLQLGSSVKMTSLDIGTGSIVDVNGANTLTLTGNGTPLVATGTFTPSTGTVEFASASTSGTTIPAMTYNNLIVNRASNNFALSGASTVQGTLTISAGTFTAPSEATLVVRTGITNNGTFTHNNSIVELAPSSTSTSGIIQLQGSSNISFGSLNIPNYGTTVQFQEGRTYSIANSFNAFGTNSEPVFLSSSTPGVQWYVSLPTSVDFSNLRVRDGACSGGYSLPTSFTQVYNAGNNGSCWGFRNLSAIAGGSGSGSGSSSSSSGCVTNCQGSGSNGSISIQNSAGTISNDSSYGTVAWVSPSNALTSNNAYTTATGDNNAASNYLKASNFGFAIPDGVTINGIVAEFEQNSNGSYVGHNRVRIVKADGTIGTTNKTGDQWPVGTDAYRSYGGSTDAWGETWTSANINDPDFGVAISNTLYGMALSLHADSPVSTPSGIKLIKNLKIGDEVITYNENTGLLETKKIKNVWNGPISVDDNKYFYIYVNGKVIKSSQNHKFYVNGSYIRADELKVGDMLLGENMTMHPISKIRVVKNYKDTVWDIAVEGNNNFFVNGLLAHNFGESVAMVDHIRITVYYTAGGSGSSGSSGSGNGGGGGGGGASP